MGVDTQPIGTVPLAPFAVSKVSVGSPCSLATTLMVSDTLPDVTPPRFNKTIMSLTQVEPYVRLTS